MADLVFVSLQLICVRAKRVIRQCQHITLDCIIKFPIQIIKYLWGESLTKLKSVILYNLSLTYIRQIWITNRPHIDIYKTI